MKALEQKTEKIQEEAAKEEEKHRRKCTGNKLCFNRLFPFEFYKIDNAKQYLHEG